MVSEQEFNHQLTAWNEWLMRVRADVTMLLEKRHFFRETEKLFSSRKLINSLVKAIFFRWIQINYIESAVVAARRQLDLPEPRRRDDDPISLRRLLSSMSSSDVRITRKEFIDRTVPFLGKQRADYKELYRQANKLFEELVGSGIEELTADQILSDLKSLETELDHLKDVVSTQVAHRDVGKKAQLIDPLSIEEIDKGIDLLERLVDKYSQLMFYGPRPLTIKMHQLYKDDWKELFREAA